MYKIIYKDLNSGKVVTLYGFSSFILSEVCRLEHCIDNEFNPDYKILLVLRVERTLSNFKKCLRRCINS